MMKKIFFLTTCFALLGIFAGNAQAMTASKDCLLAIKNNDYDRVKEYCVEEENVVQTNTEYEDGLMAKKEIFEEKKAEIADKMEAGLPLDEKPGKERLSGFLNQLWSPLKDSFFSRKAESQTESVARSVLPIIKGSQQASAVKALPDKHQQRAQTYYRRSPLEPVMGLIRHYFGANVANFMSR